MKNLTTLSVIYNNVLPFLTESFANAIESSQAPLQANLPESRLDWQKQDIW
jgi:hypothetical protein